MAFVIDPCPNCDFDLASIFDFRICSDELLEQISSTFGHCPSCGAYIALDKSPDDFWKQYRKRHPDEFLPMPDGYDDDDEEKDTDNGEASGENACSY